MTTNPDGAGLEPEDKRDTAAVARWYAAKLTVWRTVKRDLTEYTEAEAKARREVDRAGQHLMQALRSGSDLPDPLPQTLEGRRS